MRLHFAKVVPTYIFAMGTIHRNEGRRAFGHDPVRYHRARPPYPERVFEVLHGGDELGKPIGRYSHDPFVGNARGSGWVRPKRSRQAALCLTPLSPLLRSRALEALIAPC